jgi:lipoprotein-anchoring transpeptidase ErfK/SrfK
MVLLIVIVVGVVFLVNKAQNHSAAQTQSKKEPVTKTATTKKPKTAPVTTPVAVNPCAGNEMDKLALVSISQQHMWACDGSTDVYNSAVVTGMENLVADRTPTGTYHIYAKERDLYLNGSDSTGSWHDYVYYWMPFLSNQYGIYGFHDATWRLPSAFGNISPFSSDASHGCVELPLATAQWLFGWADVGTTVTIEA